MKKKLIIGLAVVSVLLVTGCGCAKTKKEETTGDSTVNITNEEMVKDQTVGSLEFTNTEITYDGNMTLFVSQVTNTSSEVVNLSKVVATINYLDEQEKEKTVEMEVYFGESLEPGEVRTSSNNIDVDLRKATKIEYRIVE
jgi:hypothetical protein